MQERTVSKAVAIIIFTIVIGVCGSAFACKTGHSNEVGQDCPKAWEGVKETLRNARKELHEIKEQAVSNYRYNSQPDTQPSDKKATNRSDRFGDEANRNLPAQEQPVEGSVEEQTPKADDGTVEIETGMEVGFLYYKTSHKPLPWTDFANHWDEYRTAQNEFEKADALEPIIPQIKQMKQRIDDGKRFTASSEALSLGQYDMDTGAFQVNGLDENFALISSNAKYNVKGIDYAIAFSNIKEFQNITIDEAIARDIVNKLGKDRKVKVEFTFEPKTVYNDSIPHNHLSGLARILGSFMSRKYKVVESRIISIKIIDPASEDIITEVIAKNTPETQTASLKKHSKKIRIK